MMTQKKKCGEILKGLKQWGRVCEQWGPWGRVCEHWDLWSRVCEQRGPWGSLWAAGHMRRVYHPRSTCTHTGYTGEHHIRYLRTRNRSHQKKTGKNLAEMYFSEAVHCTAQLKQELAARRKWIIIVVCFCCWALCEVEALWQRTVCYIVAAPAGWSCHLPAPACAPHLAGRRRTSPCQLGHAPRVCSRKY